MRGSPSTIGYEIATGLNTGSGRARRVVARWMTRACTGSSARARTPGSSVGPSATCSSTGACRPRRRVPRSPRGGATVRGAGGGAPFPLSERHGAWRVATEGSDETVDFTPLPDGIEADLATRDFTINAIAVPVEGGDPVDPSRRARGSRGGSRTRGVGHRSSATTRCGCCARSGSRRSWGSGWTSDGAAPARVRFARDRAGGRAEPRRASASGAGGIPAARRARAARAARRLARRSSRGARRAGLPARRRVRRAALAAPDLERPARYARDAAPRAAAGGLVAAGDPPLPPGNRAVGARRARVRGCGGARRAGRGGSRWRIRRSRSCEATSWDSPRACDRAYPRAHRRGAGSRDDLDARGRARARPLARAGARRPRDASTSGWRSRRSVPPVSPSAFGACSGRSPGRRRRSTRAAVRARSRSRSRRTLPRSSGSTFARTTSRRPARRRRRTSDSSKVTRRRCRSGTGSSTSQARTAYCITSAGPKLAVSELARVTRPGRTGARRRPARVDRSAAQPRDGPLRAAPRPDPCAPAPGRRTSAGSSTRTTSSFSGRR